MNTFTSTPMRHRRLAGLIGAVVALCMAMTGLTMQSAQAATGSITGQVFTKAVGGPEVPGTNVHLYLYYSADGKEYGSAQSKTFAGSTISLSNLAAGYYKFEVTNAGPVGYQREYYNNAEYLDDAAPIQVGADPVSLADMVLEPAGQITGRVTDSAGIPLANASVSFQRTKTGSAFGVQTDANGYYSTTDIFGDGLVKGPFRVAARHDDYLNPDAPSHEEEYWENATSYDSATAIMVTPGTTVNNINFTLDVAPRLRLTVKDPAGVPVPNAPVGVFVFRDGSWGPIQSGPHETDASGVYRSTLRIGAKFKYFIDPAPGVGGVKEWYDNAYTEATAKEVGATAHGQVINIEIKLGAAPPVMGSIPTITGSPVVGQTLTATPGTWGPTGVSLTYQWLAGGTPIAAATKSTYAPVAADAGKALTVKVTGALANHTPATKTSAATTAVTLPLVTGSIPTITGTPVVGQTLTATPGTWGPTGVALTYQWLAGGTPIDGATATTYQSTVTDIGKRITVKITGALADHIPTTKTSAETSEVTAEAVVGTTPRITGTPRTGSTLTATPGTWGPSGVALTYKWFANGVAIPGASARTLKLSNSQAGKRVTVEVRGTKAGATPLLKRSTSTAVVVGILAPRKVTISGTAKVGKKLSAKTTLWAAKPVKVTYKWYRNGKTISGQKSRTYKLRKADKGKRITVRVYQSKTYYLTANKLSSKTRKVK